MEPEEKKEEQKKRKKEVNDLLRSLKKKSLNDLTPKSTYIDLYDSDKNKDQITESQIYIQADSEPLDTFPCGEDSDHIHKLYSTRVHFNNISIILDSFELEDLTDALIDALRKLEELD